MLRLASMMTGALLVAAGTWLSPQTAAACSCAPTQFLDGEPADGATDVPIDVQPWVRAPVEAPSAIVLEDSAGNVVDAEVRVSSGGSGGYDCIFGFAEIVPRSPLEQRERYTIRLVNDLAQQFSPWSFTTGETVLAAEMPATPDARLALVDAPEHTDSCVYSRMRGCVGAAGEGTLEVSTWRSDVLTERFFIGATKDLVLDGDLSDLCFELRRRDLAGRQSPPSTICANEVSVRTDTEDAFLPDAFQPNCNLVDGLLARDPDTESETPTDPMEDGEAHMAAQPMERAAGSCSIRSSSQPVVGWFVGAGALALWLFRLNRRRRPR